MSRRIRNVLLLALGLMSGLLAVHAADKLSEKWLKRLDSADSVYQAAKLKAQNALFYAMQKANSDRLKVLKTALADATKSGDFDAATAIKERITAAEQEGTVRTKPKDVVKLGGHEYAIIEDPASWSVARQICEEMGGHLAVINSPEEGARLIDLCSTAKANVWFGAADENTEGKWKWLDGSPVMLPQFDPDNALGVQHYLRLFAKNGSFWDDDHCGERGAFLCEWDN